MTGFCVETITSDRRLRARDGILRTHSVMVTSDARALAGRIVQEARAEADRIVEEARAAAQQLARTTEADVLKRAASLLDSLERANSTFIDRAQDIIVDLAQNLFDRVVIQATPRKRIETSLKRILREAPPRLIDPVLRIHPDDLELLPEVEWEVKRDASMARGACRLEAANGEWHADFDAAVEALRNAFSGTAKKRAKRQGDGDGAAGDGTVS